MLFSRNLCIELAVCAGLLEHIVPLRICGRESRHHVLLQQRLVEVGGDLHVIRNENDHTLFAFAGHDPEDYDPHWYLREGADPNIFIDLRHWFRRPIAIIGGSWDIQTGGEEGETHSSPHSGDLRQIRMYIHIISLLSLWEYVCFHMIK
jgi:hypothetical protein